MAVGLLHHGMGSTSLHCSSSTYSISLVSVLWPAYTLTALSLMLAERKGARGSGRGQNSEGRKREKRGRRVGEGVSQRERGKEKKRKYVWHYVAMATTITTPFSPPLYSLSSVLPPPPPSINLLTWMHPNPLSLFLDSQDKLHTTPTYNHTRKERPLTGRQKVAGSP